MWHVIYGPGRTDHTYLSSWELFSLNPNDRFGRWFFDDYRRKTQEKALKQAIDEMNFEKAAVLRNLIYGPQWSNINQSAA